MIITALGNWTPEPGTALEWHPTPAAASAARSAPAHPSPPSFLQEDHLRAAKAAADRGDAHHAYTLATTDIDGHLDRDALTRAIEAFVVRHESLQCWFEVVGDVAVRRMVGPDAVSFILHEAGFHLSAEEFQQYVRRRFATEASPFAFPGFAVGAVERTDDFTVYYAADHAHTDGASHALAITELAQLYARECGDDTIALPPAGSHVEYSAQERTRAAAFHAASPEISAWKEIFDRHSGVMPRFPLELGLNPGETAPVRIVEQHLLDADATESFDRACKSAGARVSSGVFAAVAITDFEIAGHDDYFGITVLSTRHLGDYGRSQGWFVNFAPVAFSVRDAASFDALAGRAHDAFERARQIAAVPVHAVLGALAADGTLTSELAVSPNMLSYIDFRWFPGAGTSVDARAKQMTGEGRTSNASMWMNRDSEHLYLCAQVPDNDIAAASVKRYHAHLKRVLETVAYEGNHWIRTDTAVTR